MQLYMYIYMFVYIYIYGKGYFAPEEVNLPYCATLDSL